MANIHLLFRYPLVEGLSLSLSPSLSLSLSLYPSVTAAHHLQPSATLGGESPFSGGARALAPRYTKSVGLAQYRGTVILGDTRPDIRVARNRRHRERDHES